MGVHGDGKRAPTFRISSRTVRRGPGTRSGEQLRTSWTIAPSGALFEVVRREIGGNDPESALMLDLANVALVGEWDDLVAAGAASPRWRPHEGELDLQLRMTRWASVGLIVGAMLVRVTRSAALDLIVGAVIA